MLWWTLRQLNSSTRAAGVDPSRAGGVMTHSYSAIWCPLMIAAKRK